LRIPVVPDLTGYVALNASSSQTYYSPFFTIGFDVDTGAINYLLSTKTGKQWASETNPIAMFVYSTYNDTDLEKMPMFYQYSSCNNIFTKPNITANAHPASADWNVVIWEFYKTDGNDSFYINLVMGDSTSNNNYGAPIELWVKYDLSEHGIAIELQWFGKLFTRLPEASWFIFDPITEVNTGGYWMMNKLGSFINPLHVMNNGSQHVHGIWDSVYYSGTDDVVLVIESRDAALVSPFSKNPLPVPLTPPQSIAGGMNFLLHNNLWNTNYPLWYPFDNSNQDDKFRFVLLEITLER